MATLGITFTGAALSMGGKKAEDATTPPINAKSSEEESYVKCVFPVFPSSDTPNGNTEAVASRRSWGDGGRIPRIKG